MGFVIREDIETSLGPTQELYVRVEGFSFNKVTAQLGFQLTYWVDREHAIKHNRTYLEEEVKPMVGLVQNKIMYYDKLESDGEEIEFTHFLKVSVAEEQEVEVPLFEEQDYEVEVPYVSFDEEGEEITKFRKVIKTKKVQVGSNKEIRTVIDLKAFDDIYGYCYKKLFDYLTQFFPNDKIEIVK